MSQTKSAKARRSRSTFREYLEALLVAILLATFVRTYLVQVFKIPTASMEKSLLVGDHILVNKFIYGTGAGDTADGLIQPRRRVRRGDVVVFKFPQNPGRDFIKRCVALPGDRVELRDKALFVNGKTVDESGYVFHADSRTYPASLFLPDDYRLRDNFGIYTVPDGELFVLGDNRDNSNDSRFWGSVPTSYVKGRALLIYWSFSSEIEHTDWPGYLGRIRQLREVGANFLSRTRWERSLRIVR
ncbi:MAG: signal peptidase I [Acidobacteriota bacterium]|nr:signal peptidase I [Acidobacteriota bacterium]